MICNLERYKNDIEKLVQEGDGLLSILKGDNNNLLKFREEYEIWYSEALYLVKVVLPDRLDDFKNYYENKKNDALKNALIYTPPRNEGVTVEFDYKPAKQVDFARSFFVN